jgi:hypothetical protein
MKTPRVSLACVVALLLFAAGCNKQSASSTPNDQQLTSSVQSKLQAESALAGQNIQVAVNGGVVTLSGTASDAASRALAGNDAGAIPGVKTVVNNLEVQPAATTAQSAPPPAPEPAPSAAPAPAPRDRHHRDRHRSDASYDSAPTVSQNVPPPAAAPAPAPQPAPVSAPPPPPQPVQKTITLATGTVIPVRITETLNSENAQPDDTFHGSLASDLVSNGRVVIPQGTPVLGRVVEAKNATHFKGNSLLSVELTRVDLGNNRMSVVTDAFSKEGAGRGKNTAEKAGGGALLGTVIGALAGGGKGAAIGAVAGAGAGTGINAATRGQQVQIPSESLINFTLQQPLSFTITIMPGGSTQRQPYEPALSQRPPQ